jgi:hypothetical protein
MHTKTTLTLHLTSVKRATIKKKHTLTIGEDIGEKGLLYTVGAMQISSATMEISMEALHKK